MTGSVVSAEPQQEVPEGFFDEVAAMLESEGAEELADAVITVCTRRGILHPELEDDPEDELRAEQVREVFALLDAATSAVADGTIVPGGTSLDDDDFDPAMAILWDDFVVDAMDPKVATAVSNMLSTGSLEGIR